MKPRIAALCTLIFLGAANGRAADISPEPVRCWLDAYGNFRYSFNHDSTRRFAVEESSDLVNWTEHWMSPVSSASDDGSGLTTGSIDGKARFFIRLKKLPWVFDPLIASSDWLGDFAVAFQPDGKMLIAFQNRTNNSLYLVRQKEVGKWDLPELVVTTGVADDPGYYDNNGYSDVRLFVLSNGTRLIICKDEYKGEVICLKQLPNTSAWIRHNISQGRSISIWANVASTISNDGKLAIVFGGSSGAFLYTALATSPQSGNTINISASSPNSGSAVSFINSNNVLVQMGSEVKVRVGLLSGFVEVVDIPGTLLSQTLPSSNIVAIRYDIDFSGGGIRVFRSSDGGNSWSSGYTPLGNIQSGTTALDSSGKVVVLADWYGRKYFYRNLDDFTNGPTAIRLTAGENCAGLFQYPSGKYGVILSSPWGGSAVVVARQE